MDKLGAFGRSGPISPDRKFESWPVAGLFARLLGTLIDVLILSYLQSLLFCAIVSMPLKGRLMVYTLDRLLLQVLDLLQSGKQIPPLALGVLAVYLLLPLLLLVGYGVFWEALLSATPGKICAGIAVADSGMDRPGAGQILERNLLKWGSAVLLAFGGVLFLAASAGAGWLIKFTPWVALVLLVLAALYFVIDCMMAVGGANNQTWHDRRSCCVVVSDPRLGSAQRLGLAVAGLVLPVTVFPVMRDLMGDTIDVFFRERFPLTWLSLPAGGKTPKPTVSRAPRFDGAAVSERELQELVNEAQMEQQERERIQQERESASVQAGTGAARTSVVLPPLTAASAPPLEIARGAVVVGSVEVGIRQVVAKLKSDRSVLWLACYRDVLSEEALGRLLNQSEWPAQLAGERPPLLIELRYSPYRRDCGEAVRAAFAFRSEAGGRDGVIRLERDNTAVYPQESLDMKCVRQAGELIQGQIDGETGKLLRGGTRIPLKWSLKFATVLH